IEVGEITPEIARNLNLKDQRGVVVTSVEDASPAERAGIEPGAVILEVNQKEVKNIAEFQQAMSEAGKEGSVLLLVKERGGTRFVAIKF
ncbi:MAG: PDZ domain-containing protein, partial [Planctomycetota bacterium]|nr:PDZ domain-containing protein [Planctomycetota bacterium]